MKAVYGKIPRPLRPLVPRKRTCTRTAKSMAVVEYLRSTRSDHAHHLRKKTAQSGTRQPRSGGAGEKRRSARSAPTATHLLRQTTPTTRISFRRIEIEKPSPPVRDDLPSPTHPPTPARSRRTNRTTTANSTTTRFERTRVGGGAEDSRPPPPPPPIPRLRRDRGESNRKVRRQRTKTAAFDLLSTYWGSDHHWPTSPA